MKRKVYISILVLALLLAMVTGIVERYRLNKDSLVQYFPADTVFYLHARLHTDQIISNAFAKFLENHPNFDTTLYLQLSSYLQIWPAFDPNAVTEMSLGIVKHNSEFIPVLAVLVRDKSVVAKAVNNDSEYFIYQDDLSLIISSNKDVLKLSKDQTSLKDKFQAERRPLSNAWYGYVDLYQARPWLELQPDFVKIQEIVDAIVIQQSNIFASLSFRDDMLIITEDIRNLSNNDRIYSDWKLRLAHNSGFVANDIVYSSDFLHKIVDILQISDPNSKIRPGIVERFNLENRELGQLLHNFGLTPNLSVVILDNTSSSMIIELTKADNFIKEDFLQFMKQLASYDYPVKKQTKLADGSFITELIAQADDQISIEENKQSFGNIITFAAGSQVWPYSVLETDKNIYLATDVDLFAKALEHNEVLFTLEISDCIFGDSGYLANYSVSNSFAQAYILNLSPQSITFCLK